MVSSCKNNALRKMIPYLEIFWFAFSCMRTEYGDSKSSHYARMPEKYGPEKLGKQTLFTQ